MTCEFRKFYDVKNYTHIILTLKIFMKKIISQDMDSFFFCIIINFKKNFNKKIFFYILYNSQFFCYNIFNKKFPLSKTKFFHY